MSCAAVKTLPLRNKAFCLGETCFIQSFGQPTCESRCTFFIVFVGFFFVTSTFESGGSRTILLTMALVRTSRKADWKRKLDGKVMALKYFYCSWPAVLGHRKFKALFWTPSQPRRENSPIPGSEKSPSCLNKERNDKSNRGNRFSRPSSIFWMLNNITLIESNTDFLRSKFLDFPQFGPGSREFYFFSPLLHGVEQNQSLTRKAKSVTIRPVLKFACLKSSLDFWDLKIFYRRVGNMIRKRQQRNSAPAPVMWVREDRPCKQRRGEGRQKPGPSSLAQLDLWHCSLVVIQNNALFIVLDSLFLNTKKIISLYCSWPVVFWTLFCCQSQARMRAVIPLFLVHCLANKRREWIRRGDDSQQPVPCHPVCASKK